MDDRELLKDLFASAIEAADPSTGIRKFLPDAPQHGRTVVVGAGKGAAQMAHALETMWCGDISGAVVTRYGYGCTTRAIEVLEAAHPVPDKAGLVATDRMFELISDLSEDDLVIALICGGGSSLLPAPPPGLTLSDEISLNEMLLASGASISEMNVVRKHLSRIKGGRLAAATKARVVSFIVSDIPGDNPALVGSGPTVPDTSTRHDALKIAQQHKLPLSSTMLAHLQSPAADAPKPDAPNFSKHQHFIVASAGVSLAAAAATAEAHGLKPYLLSDSIEGEARDVAFVLAAIAREVAFKDRPFKKPALLLSGGETTVTLRGKDGKGGRNGEFALAFAMAIDGIAITALAADTDGIDGSENNAGAFVDGTSAKRLRSAGLDGRQLLNSNDSFSGFEAIGDLFITGPTGTNVNDFRAIIVR
ncbi:hydroxypyruvate reductase [Neorhizobium sp. 2083]|uniref:glycerate kinase type-2 family protein n=1 Tax=Neorhizobium sp. 2083 TaxID=2817762 RepID=UPI00285DC696|nr:glycerate kinase [Neorhizobium sp. 2083]MDR6817433.1 hydroxypyruvate reductase [Neorhizobium sp. 2083]